MHFNRAIVTGVFYITLQFIKLSAQISPGDLSVSHAHLEGISNCTQCHVLGNKVSNDKCLACHTEIRMRISLKKGYHSSGEVQGKQCSACHNEHHGKNFQLIRLNTAGFNHDLTGYPLSAPHSKKGCADCHNQKFITDQKLKTKKSTYLGLSTECLNCHADYHLRTLSAVCLICHNPDSFKPATEFNHDNANFQLRGRHKDVECVLCHKIKMTDGNKFQEFRGIKYSNCTSCHTDPHQNKLGQNCRQCHSEESFHLARGGRKFDHDQTGFRLEGKHMIVACNECHKSKYTDPLKHDRCADCHEDYHNRQFVREKISPDCSECHTVQGFTEFSYSVDRHNLGPFPLKGVHSAVPCYECHRKQDKWSFRNIGKDCKDCHPDIHKPFIQAKYYPDANCRICHSEKSWNAVSFNHSATQFELTGAHLLPSCQACHISRDPNGMLLQKFSGLSMACSGCHKDNHFGQFAKDGKTNCLDCHDTGNWKASKFSHDNTGFKLDGKHADVSCGKCHQPKQEGAYIYVNYKIKDFRCESCHF